MATVPPAAPGKGGYRALLTGKGPGGVPTYAYAAAAVLLLALYLYRRRKAAAAAAATAPPSTVAGLGPSGTGTANFDPSQYGWLSGNVQYTGTPVPGPQGIPGTSVNDPTPTPSPTIPTPTPTPTPAPAMPAPPTPPPVNYLYKWVDGVTASRIGRANLFWRNGAGQYVPMTMGPHGWNVPNAGTPLYQRVAA